MVRLLLVGMQSDRFARIVQALGDHPNVELEYADAGGRALAGLADKAADLVVANEQLVDMSGLAFAAKLVARNPMVNCALVSALGDEAFHEAGEGLGILARLPPDPDETHAAKLLQQLKKVTGPDIWLE